MSLDLYLNAPPCDACGRSKEAIGSFNVTYNLSPMWHAAVPESRQLIKIDGMTGLESLELLRSGISALEEDPGKFKAMNPSNGWGSYEGLVWKVREMRDAATENPTAVWSSCR